jgi:hypothetical protein
MSIISPICGVKRKKYSKGIRGGAKTTLPKYKDNLKVDDDYVYSYGTPVAQFLHKTKQVYPLGYWSTTTSKHINYVAKYYGYKVKQKYRTL